MSLLDSIFSGAKAFIREIVSVVAETVKLILEEIDRSAFGKAATQMVQGVTKRYFNSASDLAEEERELAEKRRRDGHASELDQERLREIEAARDRLRKEMDTAKAKRAAEELREAQGEVVAAPVTDDEASSSIGILSTKECPACGGMMGIRQYGFNDTAKRRSFYWQCTAANALPCPTVKLELGSAQGSVIRRPDADLDGSKDQRRKIWERPDLLAKTHGRLRTALGDVDEEIVCPKHLLPMKLMQKPRADGLMLSSYEYICLGVNADGRACDQKVEVSTFPQVSATLKRREGHGIIDG